MMPFCKFGSIVASSAPVESDFCDLKRRVWKNVQLPLRLDEFIFKHLKSISGTFILAAANQRVDVIGSETNAACTSNYEDQHEHDTSTTASLHGELPEQEVRVPVDIAEMAYSESPVCKNGDKPGSAHKCINCGKSVHAIEPCSSPVPGE